VDYEQEEKMEQLFELAELTGKTITLAGISEASLLFRFSDGSYVIIRAEHCYDNPPEIEIDRRSYSLEPVESNLEELKDFGVLTRARYEVLRRQRSEREKERYEAIERKRFEELKKKYEGQ